MSLPDADRWDSSHHDELIERWRRSLEEGQVVRCQDVVIKEYLSIGGPGDDYGKWRNRDLSHVPPGVHITGGTSSLKGSFLR